MLCSFHAEPFQKFLKMLAYALPRKYLKLLTKNLNLDGFTIYDHSKVVQKINSINFSSKTHILNRKNFSLTPSKFLLIRQNCWEFLIELHARKIKLNFNIEHEKSKIKFFFLCSRNHSSQFYFHSRQRTRMACLWDGNERGEKCV